jgi:flagellar biosynthesis chaperone FliJ
MPFFRFRLQPLLEQKREAQKSAEEALAGQQKQLSAEERALAKLQQQEKRLVQSVSIMRRRLLSTPNMCGDGLEKQSDYLHGLLQDLHSAHDAIVFQELGVREAQARVTAARDHVAACRREADVLAKYREKVEKRFLRDLARKEELEEDEIGNMLFLTRSRSV